MTWESTTHIHANWPLANLCNHLANKVQTHFKTLSFQTLRADMKRQTITVTTGQGVTRQRRRLGHRRTEFAG